MFILWSIGAFFLIIPPIVLVHEGGHFLAARLCRINVEEFGLGLPPRAARLFQRKGTLYSLNWVPLGGFVRPAGENDPTVPGGLAAASPTARLIVLSAGSTANFWLAFCLLWLAFWLGPTATRITAVYPDSPAAQGGLQANDIFMAINGNKVDSARVMADELHRADGEPLEITVLRNDRLVSLSVLPLAPAAAEAGGRLVLGVEVEQTTAHGYLRRSPQAAAREAAAYIHFLVQTTLSAPHQLATGELSPAEARPVSIVGISQLAGRATNNAWKTGSAFPILLLTGLISAALGLTQLLPLPALDGGRMLFVVMELVRRRRFDPARETAVHRAGILFFLALMVVLILQDLLVPVIYR